MDVSFDSVDSVYKSMDWTYDLTNLQYEPTNQESDLTDYTPYVSTASLCAQTETFDSVDSVYQSMEPTYGLTGLRCEPTSFSYTPINWEYYLKDFDPDTSTEKPFEQTEGKAWRLLAARIPPELFDDILFFVNVNRTSRREYSWGKTLERNRGELSARDILTDLKQCSLVCLFWANKCREYMFSGTTLKISCYEDAEIFRQYIVEGCPRITPVNQLISYIHVDQLYRSGSSFLHFLYIPAIRDKLRRICIKGPVPDGFNTAKLDTPHWGIPPSVVLPSSFLHADVWLDGVCFPTFHHIIKYIRHFSCTTYITFKEVTWDGQTPTYSLPHGSNTIACHRRPRSLEIEAKRDCTDSGHLALTALMLNPNCPLHRLSDEERVWMFKSMTLFWGHKNNPWLSIGFDVSEQTTTLHARTFYFVFEQAPATDRSASALSVVGMDAYIRDPNDFPTNFDALVNHARTHPTIRALVLLFRSINNLQQSIKPFFEVLALATGTIELVLAYEEEEKRKAVCVDLVTLEPNGRIWADLPESKWYEGHLKSSHILQTQLKKKIRGSVH